MTTYVGLLHAVNVGGTGKLAMADLRTLCTVAGFAEVRTYIASGNVVFSDDDGPAAVTARLEAALAAHTGRTVRVAIRTAGELRAVLDANPFADGAPNRVMTVFLPTPPPAGAIAAITGRAGERIALGHREIYIDYGAGIATSRLVVPAAKPGTTRNANTVRRLVELSSG